MPKINLDKFRTAFAIMSSCKGDIKYLELLKVY